MTTDQLSIATPPAGEPFAFIPSEMKGAGRWVFTQGWGRKSKGVPLRLLPGGGDWRRRIDRASYSTPSHWRPWDDTRDLCEWFNRQHGRRVPSGIHALLPGFVFSAGDTIVGIDLDAAVDADGVIQPWAREIIDRYPDAYWERSASGRGLHGFCRAAVTLPDGKGKAEYSVGGEMILPNGRAKQCKVELFVSTGYIAVTGDVLHGCRSGLPDYSESIQAWIDEKFPKPTPRPAGDRKYSGGVAWLSDNELIDRIRASGQAEKFDRLWGGEAADHSAADLSLCTILAWWTAGDAAAVDRLFRQSGLMRDKWDRRDYAERTIQKAIANCGGRFYGDDWPPRHSGGDGATAVVCPDLCLPENQEAKIGTIDQDGGCDDATQSPLMLSPILARPEFEPQHPKCFKVKLAVRNVESCDQAILGLACNRADCPACRETRRLNLSGWYGGIFEQLETAYVVSAGQDAAEVERIKKRIQRAAKKNPEMDWVRLPTETGVTWLLTHAVDGASPVTGQAAAATISHLAKLVPQGKHVRASARIRMTLAKEPAAAEQKWEVVKGQPNLSKASWSRIKAVLAEREIGFSLEDRQDVGLRRLRFKLPEGVDLLEMFCEMVDGFVVPKPSNTERWEAYYERFPHERPGVAPACAS